MIRMIRTEQGEGWVPLGDWRGNDYSFLPTHTILLAYEISSKLENIANPHGLGPVPSLQSWNVRTLPRACDRGHDGAVLQQFTTDRTSARFARRPTSRADPA